MPSEEYLRALGLVFLAALAAAVVDPWLATLLSAVVAVMVVWPFVCGLGWLYLAVTGPAPPQQRDRQAAGDRSRRESR